jgi:hypothetical protein
VRILLDECIDCRLARKLVDHEVKTVPNPTKLFEAVKATFCLVPLAAGRIDFLVISESLLINDTD